MTEADDPTSVDRSGADGPDRPGSRRAVRRSRADAAAPDQAPATTTLRWAVRVVLLQATALAAVAIVQVYLDLTDKITTVRIALSVTGYVAVLTGLFFLVGLALARRKRWARGPAVVLELLQLPIGYNMAFGDMAAIGIPVLVLALSGTALLLAPATRTALDLR